MHEALPDPCSGVVRAKRVDVDRDAEPLCPGWVGTQLPSVPQALPSPSGEVGVRWLRLGPELVVRQRRTDEEELRDVKDTTVGPVVAFPAAARGARPRRPVVGHFATPSRASPSRHAPLQGGSASCRGGRHDPHSGVAHLIGSPCLPYVPSS